MRRRALALLISLASGAAAARADFFAEPPVVPAAPTAGTPVTARVMVTGCADEVAHAVVQTGNVIELRYVDPGCPVIPPGPFEQDVLIGTLAAGTYDLRLVEVSDPRQPLLTDEAVVAVAPAPCVEGALCLQGGRYEVTAHWRTLEGSTGVGHPIPLTDETGSFWFFADTNYELMVKVLDACAVNNRFWVYAAGLTDVEVTLQVDDTVTGFGLHYTSPLGTPFPPLGDTQTFPCEAARPARW